MRRLLLIVLFLSVPCLHIAAAEVALEYLGESRTPLENPHDLKLSPDGTRLFVADVGNNRVAVLDPETLALVYVFGADHQSGTHDVDFDKDGRAYVADTHNSRVTVYTLSGDTASLAGELKGGVRGPEGVLVHPNGLVYVAGAWSGNVVAYDKGRVAMELTGLSSPHDLELAADGNIWLADAGNDRMLLLSPDLKILRELAGAPYNFNGVRYQDVLADGTLIAADKNIHQVKIIAADGTLLKVIGSGEPKKGPYDFTTPEGVETRDGILWISDSGNDRIVKYRLSVK
jgi:DNA-binding beta-propeller fold protein YncE